MAAWPRWSVPATENKLWRYRVVRALAVENHKEFLIETEDEVRYLKLSEENRLKEMAEFDTKMEKGISIITDRLENKFLDRIRNCATVSKMMNVLDQEHRITTKVGLVVAKKEYQTMQFNENGDLVKYLLKHEAAARKVEEAGGTLIEEEKV